MKEQAKPHLLVVAAALMDAKGRVLLAQRPSGKANAGLWEFPGGKVELGETLLEALARELKEELDVEIEPASAAPLSFAAESREAFHLVMPCYMVQSWRGEPRAVEAAAVVWAEMQTLGAFAMTRADQELAEALRRRKEAQA